MPKALHNMPKRVRNHAKAVRRTVRGRIGDPGHRSSTKELKAIDFNQATFAMDTTASFQLLNGVAEGTDFNNRVGRRVRLKNVKLDWWYSPTGLASAADFYRHIVFYDKQPNGATPSLADVLTSINSSGTASSTAQDYMNLNNRDRFQILLDERIAVPEGTAVATGQTAVIYGSEKLRVSRFIDLKSLKTQFNGTSGTIASISTGSLYFMSVSLINANTAYPFNCQFASRVRYYDD